MKTIKLEDLYREFWKNAGPDQRTGQAFMNALAVMPGDIWNKVMDANLDCFFNDELYPKTMTFVVQNWKDIEVEG